MGELHYFLGLKVVQDQETGNVWIGQKSYTENILRRFGMKNCKAIRTPVHPSTKLFKAVDNESMTQTSIKSCTSQAVGSLLYLSITIRPDITFALNNVAKFCAKPNKQHWLATKRIIRYLKGTEHYGLLYKKGASDSCLGYSDTDWGGELDDQKSTFCYVFQIGETAISWRSKKQTCGGLIHRQAYATAVW